MACLTSRSRYYEAQGYSQVVEDGGRSRPRSDVSRGVCVAPPEGVSTTEGHDLLVVEAHAVENLTDGRGRLGGRSGIRLQQAG